MIPSPGSEGVEVNPFDSIQSGQRAGPSQSPSRSRRRSRSASGKRQRPDSAAATPMAPPRTMPRFADLVAPTQPSFTESVQQTNLSVAARYEAAYAADQLFLKPSAKLLPKQELERLYIVGIGRQPLVGVRKWLQMCEVNTQHLLNLSFLGPDLLEVVATKTGKKDLERFVQSFPWRFHFVTAESLSLVPSDDLRRSWHKGSSALSRLWVRFRYFAKRTQVMWVKQWIESMLGEFGVGAKLG